LRASARNRVAYRDGVPVAVREGDVTRPLLPMDPAQTAEVAQALARKKAPALAR
jgi:hypothetical protein